MPLDELDLKHLWDMLEAAQRVRRYTAEQTLDQYRSDDKLRMACERCVEIIGEAARRVSPETRGLLPSVQWGAIVATRHILAHEYDDVDDGKIWRIVTLHVPALIAELKPLLDANPPAPEALRNPREP